MQNSYAFVTPALFTTPKSYAPSPVWSDSHRAARFCPMPKKEAHTAYRKLKTWNRLKVSGRYGGAIGSACLRVFESLVYDFLNHKTGRLDPSYEGIAAKTGLSRATVAEALKRLKELRILNWVRRCSPSADEAGRFRLQQETNAYAILPPSGWDGFREAEPPPMHPTEWGAAPVMPALVDQAIEAGRESGMGAMVRTLALDPGDGIAAALARLGQAMQRRSPAFTGVQNLD